MDPNEALRRMREAIGALNVLTGSDEPTAAAERAYHADVLAEHAEALDGWLSSGGFPPEAWNPRASVFYTRAEIVNGSGFDRGTRFLAYPPPA
jgi:hypothetical protein